MRKISALRVIMAFAVSLLAGVLFAPVSAGAAPNSNPANFQGGEVPYGWVYPATGQEIRRLCPFRSVLVPNAISVNNVYVSGNNNDYYTNNRNATLNFFSGVYICAEGDTDGDTNAPSGSQSARTDFIRVWKNGSYAGQIGSYGRVSTDGASGGDGGNWVHAGSWGGFRLDRGWNRICYKVYGDVYPISGDYYDTPTDKGLGYCVDVHYEPLRFVGRVWDRGTGRGIPNALVNSCHAGSTRTDNNGFYAFEHDRGESDCFDAPAPAGYRKKQIRPWAPPGSNDPFAHGYAGCAPRTFCNPDWRYDYQVAGVFDTDGPQLNKDRALDDGFDITFEKAGPRIHLDAAGCLEGVQGWAFDTSSSDPVTVNIYLGGAKDTPSARGPVPVTPSVPRQDVNDAHDVSGNNGFSISIDALNTALGTDLRNGADQVFYAYVSGANGDEASSGPRTMTGCGTFTLNPSASGNLRPDTEAPSGYEWSNTITPSFGASWTVTPPAEIKGSRDTNEVKRNGAVVDTQNHNPQTYPRSPVRTYGATFEISSYTVGDKYCTEVVVYPGGGIVSKDGDILRIDDASNQDEDCDIVLNRPTFRVLQSGIRAGGTFEGGNCAAPGQLTSWFSNNTANNFYGSSAQLASIALIAITGVASGQNQPGGASASPSRLSFANTGSSVPVTTQNDGPQLGGVFGGTHCIRPLTIPAGTPVTGSPTGRKVVNPGNPGTAFRYQGEVVLEPNSAELNANSRKTIYVEGDAYISANNATGIRFAESANWRFEPGDNNNRIPSFILIATGNIYVDARIVQLDGVYMARKNIFTCAQDDGSNFSPIPANQMFDRCNRQLVVNGAFLAESVKLGRTFGTMSNERGNPATPNCTNNGMGSVPRTVTKTCAAEVFNFSPELYLSDPVLSRPSGYLRYDAVTSLPPVL